MGANCGALRGGEDEQAGRHDLPRTRSSQHDFTRPTMDDALARLDAELASVDPAALASADGAILAAACARVATAALDSARRSEDALQWARAATRSAPYNSANACSLSVSAPCSSRR